MFYLLWGILGCVKVFMSRRKAQGHVMLSRQMITEKEFLLFEKMIHRRYKIKEKSIYRDSRVIHRNAKGKYA